MAKAIDMRRDGGSNDDATAIDDGTGSRLALGSVILMHPIYASSSLAQQSARAKYKAKDEYAKAENILVGAAPRHVGADEHLHQTEYIASDECPIHTTKAANDGSGKPLDGSDEAHIKHHRAKTHSLHDATESRQSGADKEGTTDSPIYIDAHHPRAGRICCDSADCSAEISAGDNQMEQSDPQQGHANQEHLDVADDRRTKRKCFLSKWIRKNLGVSSIGIEQ